MAKTNSPTSALRNRDTTLSSITTKPCGVHTQTGTQTLTPPTDHPHWTGLVLAGTSIPTRPHRLASKRCPIERDRRSNGGVPQLKHSAGLGVLSSTGPTARPSLSLLWFCSVLDVTCTTALKCLMYSHGGL